jgi:hypothetical protein
MPRFLNTERRLESPYADAFYMRPFWAQSWSVSSLRQTKASIAQRRTKHLPPAVSDDEAADGGLRALRCSGRMRMIVTIRHRFHPGRRPYHRMGRR